MADRFEKFTERAKKSLMLAEEEAKRFNHNYIGTEHQLVGLVAEGNGVAAKVLKGLGVDLPRVREALMFFVGRGDAAVQGELALAPRAKRVIELAMEEAARLNHNYVGTEHLLLGQLYPQLGEKGQPAAGYFLLQRLNVEPERVREAIMDIVARPPAGAGAARPRDNVVTCRVDTRTLETLDALVEAGVYDTRSEAAARLILAGIEANGPLLEKVFSAVAQIRKVREDTQRLAQLWKNDPAPPAPAVQ